MSKLFIVRGTLEKNDKQIPCDWRLWGFFEWDVFNGKPVFYFHGFPDSCLKARLTKDSTSRIGIHLIGINCPGYSEGKKEYRNSLGPVSKH